MRLKWEEPVEHIKFKEDNMKEFFVVTDRNRVSNVPVVVFGNISVGCFINGSHVYDKDILVSYDTKVSRSPGTWLSWEVKEVINMHHGYTGEPFMILVVKPLHDSSGNCFPRRIIWVEKGLNEILPCGHVRGWCTCEI